MKVAWSDRWWEVGVLLLAANSVVFGAIWMSSGHPIWALATGFVPAAGLLVALALGSRSRTATTALVMVCGVAAAFAWWMIYPAVLAAMAIFGGLATGRIGFTAARS